MYSDRYDDIPIKYGAIKLGHPRSWGIFQPCLSSGKHQLIWDITGIERWMQLDHNYENWWINYNVSRSMRCNEMWPVTWIDSDRGCHETSWINWQWVPCQKDEEPEVLKHGYTFFTILQTLLSLLNPFWIDIGFIFSRMVLEGQKQFAGDGLPKVKHRRSPASSYWSSFHPYQTAYFGGETLLVYPFPDIPMHIPFMSFPFR